MNLTVFGGHERAVAGSDNIVIIGSSRAVEFGNIAVFKVPENFRTLTEVYCCRCRNRSTLNRCRYGTGCNSSVACGEGKPVNSSDSVIGKRKQKVGSLEFNFVQAVSRCKVQGNGPSVRYGYCRTHKRKLFGNYRVDRDRTHGFSVVRSGDGDVADSSRGKKTVLICTVGNAVGNILGDHSRCARGRYARYGDLGRGTGGNVLVGGIHGNVIEHV